MSAIAGLILGALIPWSAFPGEAAGRGDARPVQVRVEVRVTPETGAGDPITIAVRIINDGSDPVVLELVGRTPVFDILVWDRDGTPMWSKLGDDPVPAIVRLERLGPGEAIEWTHVWDQRATDGVPVPAGSYLVGALIHTSGEPFRAGPVPLRIGGRPPTRVPPPPRYPPSS